MPPVDRLFNGPYFIRSSEVGRQYDVTSDGQRFVMIKDLGRDTPRPSMIVRGWADELKRHVQ